MRQRILRRAGALALAGLLAVTATAFADTVPADGDDITSGNQALIELGTLIVGETVTREVDFALTCAGTSHAVAGQTGTILLGSSVKPLDSAVTATSTSIGPVPAGWPAAGAGCGSPAPTVPSSGPSIVTLTMPTTPGTDYNFVLMYARSGLSGLSGVSAITFTADVVPNTPPTLTLPGSITAEATSPAGAAVSWTATAQDGEDDPDPTPTCSPASGSTFALGTTTVTCSVADRIGATASGSFEVTVADTGDPTLAGLPGDLSLTTDHPAGTALSYTPPTATDAADAAPTVDCLPAPGATIPVGTTTVTCTARDASGNTSTGSFAARVDYVPSVTYEVTWGEPIGGSPATLSANPGRTVPIKATVHADGARVTSGEVVLTVEPCAGGSGSGGGLTLNLGFEGPDRWAGHLDVARLAGPGCYTASLTVDGVAAGSFRLDLRGAEPAAHPVPRGKKS